jgi:drug/metabolite transporter (DMT)-like permease
VAQTRKKRRRKHRGTQGGRIDTNRRSRPRSRAEAKAQARSRRSGPGQRPDSPPTWRGAAIRGLVAAVIFAFLLLALFKRPAGEAFGLSSFMLLFYIPAGYYIDMALWRKRERGRIRARESQ